MIIFRDDWLSRQFERSSLSPTDRRTENVGHRLVRTPLWPVHDGQWVYTDRRRADALVRRHRLVRATSIRYGRKTRKNLNGRLRKPLPFTTYH